MATLEAIDDHLAQFLGSQPVFFVATAPSGPEGHVNCSPKGNRGDFRVLGPLRVAYQDRTGSGVETIAHLRENGRIVLMFCAFEGLPRIVRLHGRARPVFPGEDGYGQLAPLFPDDLGRRSFIVVEVERVSSSCGFGVPLMELQGPRDNMEKWAQAKGEGGLAAYRARKNAVSIDGLEGLPAAVLSPGPAR